MKYMNNIIDFFRNLFILLDSSKVKNLKDFANELEKRVLNSTDAKKIEKTLKEIKFINENKEEYYFKLAIDFLGELEETPFFRDSYIGLGFEYDDKYLSIVKDKKLYGVEESDEEQWDDDIVTLTFSEIKNNFSIYKDIIVYNNLNEKDLQQLKKIFFNLDSDEELELYKALNYININELEIQTKNNIEAIKDLLKEACSKKFEMIKNTEVIKIPNINIEKNLDQILYLYDVISEDKIVNIENNNGNLTKSVKLIRVYYDLDAYTWKLEFLRKGIKESIRIDYIKDIYDSDTIVISSEKIRKYNKRIKFRVFHEENAKEKALRYAVKYNMTLDIKEDYTDIIISISDDEKFLRWVRTMTPSVVILEPLNLREKMIKEIKAWNNIYK